MSRLYWRRHLLLCLLLAQGGWVAETHAAPRLTPEQIVERHVAARGGLEAWRAVQTLSLTGKMEAGNADSATRSALYVKNSWRRKGKPPQAKTDNAAGSSAPAARQAPQVELPFVLEMKRPHKSRLEIQFAGTTAVQVYDGTHGWKVRPFLNRSDVEPFTAEEARSESRTAGLEGPLVDYVDKGTSVALEGVEKVDGHDAYKLKLTTKSGDVRRVWIDGQSFLDVKVEGTPQRMDGRMRSVFIYQRDFRAVHGVMVPFQYETVVDGALQSHKMLIEKAAVNPALDDTRFAKPQPLLAANPAKEK